MLKQRVLTALIAVAILLSVLFYAPQALARVVIGGLFVAAAWEWSQFLGEPAGLMRGLFVGLILASEILLSVVVTDLELHLYILYAALGWWLVALAWTFYFPTPIPRVAAWLCGLLMLVPAFIALDWLYMASPWLLLSVLMLVWIADIGAYFTGRAFGRVKLAPRVSPGKTWEGVFGGLTLSLLATGIVTFTISANPLVVLPFCAVVVLVSIVGDLTVSMFKRHAGIKDSGRLFPGHGGVLDRVDSVCAAAPVFAAGTRILGLA
jgi:phosphatidate cytidylyltransferase